MSVFSWFPMLADPEDPSALQRKRGEDRQEVFDPLLSLVITLKRDGHDAAFVASLEAGSEALPFIIALPPNKRWT